MKTPDTPEESLRIIELHVENVKYVRAITVRPKGEVTIIAGKNSQGKTSLMDALAMALGGKSLIPDQPIRIGATSGKASVLIGTLEGMERYQVERRFTPKGSQLYVKGKDGESFRSPQALLDALVGDLTFDPSEFVRMNKVDQLRTLQGLVGLDFSTLNAGREAKFNRRTEVNRTVSRLEAVVNGMPRYPEAPIKEIELDDIGTQLYEATAHNKNLEALRANLTKATETLATAINLVQRLEIVDVFLESDEVADVVKHADELGLALLINLPPDVVPLPVKQTLKHCQAQIEAATKTRDFLSTQKDEATDALEKFLAENGNEKDTAALLAEHTEAEELNKQIRANKSYLEKSAELTAARTEAGDLTRWIEAIDAEKRARLAAAKFPVTGLSFTEDTVTLNGVPFAQVSSSDQVRVSFGMALALNEKKPLRLCLIRAGAFLDEDNLALIEEMAVEAQCGVWIERVGGDGNATVIIEAGEVKERES